MRLLAGFLHHSDLFFSQIVHLLNVHTSHCLDHSRFAMGSVNCCSAWSVGMTNCSPVVVCSDPNHFWFRIECSQNE